MAIYGLLVVLLAVVLLVKVGLDIGETLRVRRIRRTMLRLATEQYQPSVLVMLSHTRLDSTLRVIDQLSKINGLGNAKVIISRDKGEAELSSVKLRLAIKQSGLKNVTVSGLRNSDAYQQAVRLRRQYELVMALPDTATVNPNIYRDAVLPMGEGDLEATVASHSISPNSSLISTLPAIVGVWTNSLGLTSLQPRDVLLNGGLIASSSLTKDSLTKIVRTSPLYVRRVKRSSRSVVASMWAELVMRQAMLILTPGVVMVTVLLASYNQPYASLLVGVMLAVVYYLTWRLLAGRLFGLYDMVTLILVAPFVYLALSVVAAAKIISLTASNVVQRILICRLVKLGHYGLSRRSLSA